MTKATSTKIDNKYNYNYSTQYIERGWLCDRCGRVNAPWVRQCDCSPGTYKITVNPTQDWLVATCHDETFKVHPESTIYTTNVNQVAGGSDYKDSVTGTYVNVPKTYTNIT